MQEAAPAAQSALDTRSRPGITPSAAATAILVVLADVLILTVRPGLGWFVFAASIAGVLAATAIGRNQRNVLVALAVGIVGALPLIEAPSVAATVVALAGLAIAALVAADLFPRTIEAIPGVLVRFVPLMPFRLAVDSVELLTTRSESNWVRGLFGNLLGWIVPLVFVAIFLGLFLMANPVMDLFASQLRFGRIDFPDPVRVFFWGVVAAAVWALVRPRLITWPTSSPGVTPPIFAAGESRIFGRAAIARSLVVFNAIFAVQTAMDLTYLWGGAALPAGMSYADYAHRGATPLIVTALLAAAFVLAAMRPNGPGIGSPFIRRLVYAWIGQNILLCVSSMLRLDLYVEAYSLTEFRIAAGIWMVLVVIGLGLIVLRIALQKSNAWLIATNLMSLTIMLCACASIDFSALIARFNVEHSREISGQGVALDLDYLEGLGVTVIPALDVYIAAVPNSLEAHSVRARLVQAFNQWSRGDWRSWTFRDQRLAVYLDTAPATDDNRVSGAH